MAAYQSFWSDLPTELLSCIAKLLDDNRMDLLRFRSVCSSWRGSVPFPPRYPKFPLEVQFLANQPPNTLDSFVISQETVYRIYQPGFGANSNKKSWFIKVKETKEENKFHILNPFSQHPIKNMPASFPKELNHLNFRVEETARTFSIRPKREGGDSDINENNTLFRKIKLNSDFDTSYGVAAISKTYLIKMRVDTDIQWSLLDYAAQYRDITNFKGKFFTVSLSGFILGFDETNFTLDEVQLPLEQQAPECERYFVESCGHLYMVTRDFYICSSQVHYDRRLGGFVKEIGLENADVRVKFRVLKRIHSDHQHNKFHWVEVNDLGDQVFFVSTDCSFSFSTRDSEGIHGNCIIYLDELLQPDHNEELEEEDNDKDGLWQLKNGKVGLFSLKYQFSIPLSFSPQYLAMFWPPPTWLMWDQGSSSSSIFPHQT